MLSHHPAKSTRGAIGEFPRASTNRGVASDEKAPPARTRSSPDAYRWTAGVPDETPSRDRQAYVPVRRTGISAAADEVVNLEETSNQYNPWRENSSKPTSRVPSRSGDRRPRRDLSLSTKVAIEHTIVPSPLRLATKLNGRADQIKPSVYAQNNSHRRDDVEQDPDCPRAIVQGKRPA